MYHRRLTRRELLQRGLTVGAGLAAFPALAACGGDDESATATSGEGGTSTTAGKLDRSLVPFSGTASFVASARNRLPFGIGDRDGLLPTEASPKTLTVTILDEQDQQVGDPIEATRHADGLPRAYYPLEFEAGKPGLYTARAEVDGVTAELAFQVLRPGDLQLVKPGDPMPQVDTPTTKDAHGVKPICTREPACPLHEVSLREALAGDSPIGLLISTPAFCGVSICGPVLDLLLEQVDGFPGVRFIHAEVYADPAASLNETAPIVQALRLPFEPVLVLARPDGTVTTRLDTIFDRAELEATLHAFAG